MGAAAGPIFLGMARKFQSHRTGQTQDPKRPTNTDTKVTPPARGSPDAKASNAMDDAPKTDSKSKPKEIGGPSGPEPTRYGDWERNGICVDF